MRLPGPDSSQSAGAIVPVNGGYRA